jgi:hypothetical protein
MQTNDRNGNKVLTLPSSDHLSSHSLSADTRNRTHFRGASVPIDSSELPLGSVSMAAWTKVAVVCTPCQNSRASFSLLSILLRFSPPHLPTNTIIHPNTNSPLSTLHDQTMCSHTKQHPYIPNSLPVDERTYRLFRLRSCSKCRFSFEREASDPLVTEEEILTYILQLEADYAETQNEDDRLLMGIFGDRFMKELYRKRGQFVFFGPPPPRPVVKTLQDMVPEGWRELRFCRKQVAEAMEAFGGKSETFRRKSKAREMSLVVKSARGNKRAKEDEDDTKEEAKEGEPDVRRKFARTEGRKRRCVLL